MNRLSRTAWAYIAFFGLLIGGYVVFEWQDNGAALDEAEGREAIADTYLAP